MKRALVKFTNKDDEIIECGSFYNISGKWTFLKDGAIVIEFSQAEVVRVKEISELPFGKVLPKPRK